MINEINEQTIEQKPYLPLKEKSRNDLPDYLKVSNRIFRQMLISSLEDADTIVKRLNTIEKLNFARQYAHLFHRLFYVQLQQDQWKYYYDIDIKENIWSGRVSTKWALMNSMYHTYGRSKQLIEQRLHTIARQLQEASPKIQEFSNQPLPPCILEMNPPLDFPFFVAIITAFVRKGQYKLKQQFESKKKMLILDSTDHRLVQAVYNLKPTKQQIRAIRNRWKAIYNKIQIKEQIEILKHRIHSNRLPPAFNLLDYSLDKIEKILTRSPKSSITNSTDQETVLSARRLKKIGRFKYDILELSIAAGEEKHALFPDLFQQLIVAVETREQHMLKRADYLKQEKLKSFFDDAPTPENDIMDDNSNDSVGAINH
ncbi:unnamed protein product [Rotaria sordida]|uniref:Uncharacterized protein n=1 Tax=Rotaria sordida TaxID=392033 RepID=A0A819NEJ9_9BILA|nr:unnamed protein product [Rotaria sordida]CAF3992361.1 unnamed protein product [Rotaria sordida]